MVVALARYFKICECVVTITNSEKIWRAGSSVKETGARCGEILQLNWTDVDFESKVVNITPEKNSNPRVARLSIRLLEMLEHLQKNYGDRVFSFPHMRINNYAVNFQRPTQKTANKI